MFLWTLFVYSVQYLGGITLNVTLIPLQYKTKKHVSKDAHFVLYVICRISFYLSAHLVLTIIQG